MAQRSAEGTTEVEHYYCDGVRRIQTVLEGSNTPAGDTTRAEYVYGPDYVSGRFDARG